MRKRTVRAATVSLALLALVAGGAYVYRLTQSTCCISGEHGDYLIVPDFTLPDREGVPITLSKVRAPVRIVNFWASWSPYSHDELLTLARLKDVYGSDVEVLAIDRDTNENDGRSYLNMLGIVDKVTFVFDANDTYFKQVGGFNMPETMFINERGEIVAHTHGPMRYEEVEVQVRQLLGR